MILVRKACKRISKPKLWELSDEIPESGEIIWSNNIDGEYLKKAIYSLPEGFRMVFTLIEIEGYSHKEVANILGISEGTSKSQLFYSKKRLREILS